MSALSALLGGATAPSSSAQTSATTAAAGAADMSAVNGSVAAAAAQDGGLTLMFQQLLAAALSTEPQSNPVAVASSQLPAVIESLTAQLVSANGGKSSTSSATRTNDDAGAPDPTDVAAVAAALLAALQFMNTTPAPVAGGASATAPATTSETADAAIDTAPAITAALAQLLTASAATSATSGDSGAPRTPLTGIPAPGDTTLAPIAVDAQAKPAGDLALPALIAALKIPDDSLRGAAADASPTQHVIERLSADTAAIIPQTVNDGRADSAAAPVVERTVTVPMQHPAWTEAVASQVQWCVDQGVQSAKLQITPEHLGPVEIKLDIADGKVNVSFGASHAETRAALEQSIPRLRELMSGAGLSLGQATVQQQMRQDSRNQTPQASAPDAVAADDGFVPLHRVLGLVDEYA